MGAAVEPGDEFAPLLPDPVLDVDLFRLVAGEGDVDAGERAVLQGLLPFELVQEVVGEVTVAEKEPVAARASVARRSCTKARNGATPVPGPTMMMSVAGFAGRRKCLFGFTRTFSLAPVRIRSATWTEATPVRARSWVV